MSGERAAFESFLERLDVEERAALFHLIACHLCSGDTLVDLLARDGPGLLLRRPMLPETAAERQARQEFESREGQEWAAEAGRGNVDRGRGLRMDLLASRELQRTDPARSWEIVSSLLGQGEWLAGKDLWVEAVALRINAARLAKLEARECGEDEEEDLLRGASSESAAQYRRARGLMLWQQGELESAREYLFGAAADFGEAAVFGEEGATLTLLGLLLEEEGEQRDACFMLMAGLSGMSRGPRPWLEARGLLALAAVWARGGRKDFASGLLKHAGTHYGSVIESDARLLWAQGKALAVMEESAAVARLTEALDRMVAERRLGEAVLVTLDLTCAKVQQGRAAEAAADVGRLGEQFADELTASVKGTLERWWDKDDGAALEGRWEALERALLSDLRDGGAGLAPVPFV